MLDFTYLSIEKRTAIHNWPSEQSRLLITLFSENQSMFTSGEMSQKQCWAKVSKLFKDKGHVISGYKCSTKFQPLKGHKNISDHNNTSGNSRKTWEYFEDMQNIFKTKPWVEPLSTAGSDDVDCGRPIEKPKKVQSSQFTYLKELLRHKSEKALIREKQHKEKLWRCIGRSPRLDTPANELT